MSDYNLTEIQAKAILDMKLQKLANLEQEKIRKEHAELLQKISKLKEILSDINKVYSIIKEELEEIIATYGDDRKTEIIATEEDDIILEDLIKEEEVVVTISNKGYVKRTPLSLYKAQGRGGKGITAAKTTDGDFIQDIYVTNTHNYLLIFTTKGKVYWLKVYNLPDVGRSTKGKPIINLLDLEKEEKVSSIIPIPEFDDKHNIVMVTEKGIIKKTNLINFSRPRKSGIIAVLLDEGDSLIKTVLTKGNDEIVIATANGLAARIPETSIRAMGRVSRGVIGIRLDNDKVIGMVRTNKDNNILTISEKGYGKKTPVSDYRLINRGGKGVINLKVSDKTGRAISIHNVKDSEELILISKNGISLRTSIKNISTIGRNTQGVRIMRLKENDFVVGSAVITPESSEEYNNIKEISEDISKQL
jgi:DNA gyrase subunit A